MSDYQEQDRQRLYTEGRRLARSLQMLGMTDAASTVETLCERISEDGSLLAFTAFERWEAMVAELRNPSEGPPPLTPAELEGTRP